MSFLDVFEFTKQERLSICQAETRVSETNRITKRLKIGEVQFVVVIQNDAL